MKTNAMKVGYRLVRNATSTADKAPYLGIAVPVGSLAYDNVLRRMLDRGTHMTRATAQYFLNAFYEFAAETIADDVVRINMGAVSIYPMIGGSFDSEDDAYREPRNTLYVGATLSQEIRDAVAGIVPDSLGAERAVGSVTISSVMDLASATYRLIDGTNEFRIVGIDLTVPDGEDESLTLVATDGVTKVADITVVSTEDGQRIVCTLASAVPVGTYNVRLVSHGLDPTAPLVTVLHRVTVKAGETPPEPPVPTGPTVTAINGGTFLEGGGTVVHGENMRFADAYPGNHVVIKDSEGTDMGAMISTDESIPVTEESFGLTIDAGTPFTEGAEYTFEFAMLDADGQPVTVTQTATYVAE